MPWKSNLEKSGCSLFLNFRPEDLGLFATQRKTGSQSVQEVTTPDKARSKGQGDVDDEDDDVFNPGTASDLSLVSQSFASLSLSPIIVTPCPVIHPSIQLSVYSFILPFIHPSTHSFIHQSIHPSIHPSTHSFIIPFIHSFYLFSTQVDIVSRFQAVAIQSSSSETGSVNTALNSEVE